MYCCGDCLVHWREANMAACQVRTQICKEKWASMEKAPSVPPSYIIPCNCHFIPVCGDARTNSIYYFIIVIYNYRMYRRPSIVPFPSVYHRFTVTKAGTPCHLRVQDMTEDQHQPAMDMLTKYFTRDEPPCKYIEINKYPSAVAELQKLWRNAIKENLSLACVTDDDSKTLVGVNVLTVISKEDKEEPFQTDDEIWAKLFGAVDFVSKAVDIFSHYGVDKYLNAYGLVVHPDWRGLNIGRVILETRIPFCKALGIKVTATVFTAGASQAVAKKAGFEVLYEITYEELAKKGFVFPGVEKDTKSSKLMALVVE